MKSPADMRIIQIDITNACSLKCSNCTRFCGNHKKPFFMDADTFKKAVDSLEGFERTIGIMGGEPTLHPDFEAYANYLAQKHPPKYKLEPLRYPVSNFIEYLRDKNYFWDESLNQRKGPGLWTCTGTKYYENFETIQNTFSYQLINDHKNSTLHQPMLVSRKDLGIPDEEWFKLRDNCWVQNMWSATITPKGAFFCEIAGALDMLFDGPGGWPIEPGWWKRQPEAFGDQLNWCELCGAALPTKGRLSDEGIDDVSPSLLEMLKKVESPRVKQGKVMILKSDKIGNTNMPDTRSRYLESYDERISEDNRSLFPRRLEKHKLNNPAELFNIEKLRDSCGNDWVLLYAEEEPSSEYLDDIDKFVFNPGVAYCLGEKAILFNTQAIAIRRVSGDYDMERFLKLWPPNRQIALGHTIKDDSVSPDFKEWVLFAREQGVLTCQVTESLKKIASDHNINLSL